MTGYVRQSEAEIQNDLDILAADLNAEFDAIETAMDVTTGHNHDGTVGGGAAISYSDLTDKPTPALSNDDSIARYSSTTGTLQDSTAYIYDNGNLDFVYTEDGSGLGPYITLTRNSVSPAASDNLGALRFMGKDSAGNTTTYGRIRAIINDPTDTSEDSTIRFDVMSGGSDTNVCTISSTAATFNVPLSLSTDLAVTHGGTGASDASGARTNLGLGTIATQNSNNVAITGGGATNFAVGAGSTISGTWISDLTAPLATAYGGTGASDVVTARANLGIAWELIGSSTVSAGSALIFTGLSAYRILRVHLYVVPSVDGVDLYLRTSTDDGATFDSGASDYDTAKAVFNAGSGLTSASGSYISILTNVDTTFCSAALTLYEFNITRWCRLSGITGQRTGGGVESVGVVSGVRTSTTARNAIRISPVSGTFTGTAWIEGIRG